MINRTQPVIPNSLKIYLSKLPFLHCINEHVYYLKITGSYGHMEGSVTNFSFGPDVSSSVNELLHHLHPGVIGGIVKGLPPSQICCLQTISRLYTKIFNLGRDLNNKNG